LQSSYTDSAELNNVLSELGLRVEWILWLVLSMTESLEYKG